MHNKRGAGDVEIGSRFRFEHTRPAASDHCLGLTSPCMREQRPELIEPLERRGRRLLLAIFWILVIVTCVNIRVLLDRYDLPHLWTQLAFLGSTILLFCFLWLGLTWARWFGVILLVCWT